MESNFNKYPSIKIKDQSLFSGWDCIWKKINTLIQYNKPKTIVVECYQGIHYDELAAAVHSFHYDNLIEVESAYKSENEIREMTWPDVTDDRVFGFMTRLRMADYFDATKLENIKSRINTAKGTTIIFGFGASLLVENPDILIYADMPRWEIQLRMRRHEVHSIGIANHHEDFAEQYKRAFFVDWRVCDHLKQTLYSKMDFVLDSTIPGLPKMISGDTFRDAFRQASLQPVMLAPFFDPGPWGGQWMKEVCNLDKTQQNFAWCFNCVTEENSLLLDFNGTLFETPSINLVFSEAENLLGEAVESRFGKEFPIRFDLLDTMGGGNLSLQVHPLTKYIQESFGMHYTQDESYYMLDAGDDATVYLGLKNNVDKEMMHADLVKAQSGEDTFDAEKYVNLWPAKKHDHFLIPAGTVHCSGKNGMVLEISSTPYIFTFKLWDWGRLGLDGKPRPINIEHGMNVIQWHRDTDFTKKHLINKTELIDSGDGWKEEKTGLYCSEFIETRRHWFSKTTHHNTHGGVNVLNLVEGAEAIIESPNNSFEPMVVHYAETFIIPAAVGEYTISPYGKSMNKTCGTIKAFIRVNA